jgi:hypothetical protein
MRAMFKMAVLALAVVAASPAQAIIDFSSELIAVTDLGGGNYSFTQSGFSGGGIVNGSFSGIDDNGDLQLMSFDDEITAFSMSLTGNAFVTDFTLGFADLYGLVYDLDGGPLGDFDSPGQFEFEGISADNGIAFYDAGPGPFEFCGEGYPCALVLNYVPEPSSWAMLITGFGMTGAVMRRRRYRAA